MATFRAKIPRKKSSFEGLNFEGIIPCRSVEDVRCDAVSTEIRTKEIEETADCTVVILQ